MGRLWGILDWLGGRLEVWKRLCGFEVGGILGMADLFWKYALVVLIWVLGKFWLWFLVSDFNWCSGPRHNRLWLHVGLFRISF